ncbi:MAG: NBR1-Ig-like domain-containing protein [bacterium]
MPFFLYDEKTSMKQKTKQSFLFFTILLIAIGVLVFPAQAQHPPETKAGTITNARVLSVSTERTAPARSGTIVSDILAPAFSFNGVLADFSQSLVLSDRLSLDIRVEHNGVWSAWIPVPPLDGAPSRLALSAERSASEPVFFQPSERFQYRLSGDIAHITASVFRDINFTYVDSATPNASLSWLGRILQRNTAAADGAVPIISRSAWGADESYRFPHDDELWQPTYAPVQKFIIHHTAGSNGGSDPAAVVRGIYYFHAVTLGWGDIGYNYLVDPLGKIYEGRYGGDGVIGGHTYNDQERTDYNPGTMGISFLGNYQTDIFTDAERASVTALIAEKAQLFSISPTGTSTFHERQDLPNIIGHRDVDATTCPGANIYSQLDSIRAAAGAQLAVLPSLPAPQFSAQLATASPIELPLEAGKTATATVQFTNTSNIAWQSYIPARSVTLRPLAVPSQLASDGWSSQDAVGNGDTANVLVGTPASFSIPLLPAQELLTTTESFALFAPDNTELPGTRFTLNVQVRNHEYAGTIDSVPIKPATFLKSTKTVTVYAKNLGTKTWNPGDVVLNVTDIDGTTSRYRTTGWPKENGAFPLTATVAAGEQATFIVKMKTPATPGTYANLFSLERADGSVFATEAFRTITRADSMWQAQFVAKKYPVAVKRGWSNTMLVTFKNTGTVTWTRKLTLRVYDRGFQPSRFLVLPAATGKGTLKEQSVRPGQTGTFLVKLKSPSKTGVYHQVLRLEVPGSTVIVQNGIADVFTRVDR